MEESAGLCLDRASSGGDNRPSLPYGCPELRQRKTQTATLTSDSTRVGQVAGKESARADFDRPVKLREGVPSSLPPLLKMGDCASMKNEGEKE